MYLFAPIYLLCLGCIQSGASSQYQAISHWKIYFAIICYLLSNTLVPPELSRWDMTALCSADFRCWSPISDQMASHELPPSDCLCNTNLISSLRLWEMEDCPLCSAESLWTQTSCMENHHFYRDRWSEAAGGWSPEPLCYQWFMWHP